MFLFNDIVSAAEVPIVI